LFVVCASSGFCTICTVFFVFFRFDSLSEVSLFSSLFGGLVQVVSFRGARRLSRVLLSSLPASVHLVFFCDSVSLPQPHRHRENSNCFPLLLLILLSEETSSFDLIVSEKIRLFFPLLIPSVCTASRKEGRNFEAWKRTIRSLVVQFLVARNNQSFSLVDEEFQRAFTMDSIEGQLYDIPADCHPRDLGDSDVELLGLEKKKARGLSDHRSGPSSFFWASEEDEMESAPPGVKNKLKRMIQATDCPEVVDEAGGVLEKVEERWHELPPELLVQILALVDHRTVVVVTGVCSSWRQSISTGIHELSFSWCGRSVSKLVQSVAPHFLSLQSCNLRRCMYLVDPAIEAIGAHWHDLRTLDLSSGTRLTDASLYDLARGCTLLEKLDLSGCVGITEAGLVVLAECCKNLRHLNLCGCIIAGSDTALVALAQHCRSLQSLNLGWCEHITDIGVTALVIGCSDLRVLDLCGCHLITGWSFWLPISG
jgi:hypothetical protein